MLYFTQTDADGMLAIIAALAWCLFWTTLERRQIVARLERFRTELERSRK